MIEFSPWPKIARLFRNCTITEKLDGTNAAIGIRFGSLEEGLDDGSPIVADDLCALICRGGTEVNGLCNVAAVYAQSRKRIITPKIDNHGFAGWVRDNAAALVDVLGPGLHFGEWWGSGINRAYGLAKGEHRFSLFNTKRWGDAWDFAAIPGLDVVPTLYEGLFSTEAVKYTLGTLRLYGSQAVPGFTNPEGVVVYHHAANEMFKVTLENDEVPKALAEKESLRLAA